MLYRCWFGVTSMVYHRRRKCFRTAGAMPTRSPNGRSELEQLGTVGPGSIVNKARRKTVSAAFRVKLSKSADSNLQHCKFSSIFKF